MSERGGKVSNATLELKNNPNYIDPDISAFTRRDHTSVLPINVVVSRYNRDVTWTEKLRDVAPVHIMIYDKCNPSNPYNVPVNKGNEASAYLKYIIDHYEELPEWTFFIHDEEYSWHHSGSVVDKFQYALDSGLKFYNINDLAFLDHVSKTENAMILEWWRIHIEKYIPLKSLSLPLFGRHIRACAQFLVHRDNILRLPKQFYLDMYAWLMRTELSNYHNGRLFEWTWHIILG